MAAFVRWWHEGSNALMLVGTDHLDEHWVLIQAPVLMASAGRSCDRIGYAEPSRVNHRQEAEPWGKIGQNKTTTSA
jgi:hypothetical protein